MNTRCGIGFDVHRLVEGHRLILGGVDIRFELGLAGHSDGDVLTHAVIDAVLGGAGLGDIGQHFPSDDETYRNIASTRLLQDAIDLTGKSGWKVTYVDATIIAERPRLSPFIDSMQLTVASVAGLSSGMVNLKASTTDGLGTVGEGDGIAAMAVATLVSIE